MFKRISIIFVPAFLVAFNAAAHDFRAGLTAYERGNYAAALREFRPLADKGSPLAQYQMGLMYENGWGVERDYAQAANWYQKAANRGHARAKLNLDFIYLMGVVKSAKASSKANMRRARIFKDPVVSNRRDIRIQLGSVKSKLRAIKEAKRVLRAHRSILGESKIFLVPADLGRRGTFYRLRVGPLQDRASAELVCRQLARRDQGCLVVAN